MSENKCDCSKRASLSMTSELPEGAPTRNGVFTHLAVLSFERTIKVRLVIRTGKNLNVLSQVYHFLFPQIIVLFSLIEWLISDNAFNDSQNKLLSKRPIKHKNVQQTYIWAVLSCVFQCPYSGFTQAVMLETI